jgi:hypothetical protein
MGARRRRLPTNDVNFSFLATTARNSIFTVMKRYEECDVSDESGAAAPPRCLRDGKCPHESVATLSHQKTDRFRLAVCVFAGRAETKIQSAVDYDDRPTAACRHRVRALCRRALETALNRSNRVCRSRPTTVADQLSPLTVANPRSRLESTDRAEALVARGC